MTAVTPISIKGKPYIQVAGRVTLAHEDEGFSMISSETFELANRYFCRVTIAVKDCQYIGTSEIKFTAKAGTADGDSPVECAETSALGRALGYAGYGSVESLASADEVMRNEQLRQDNEVLKAMKLEAKKLGICGNLSEWSEWKASVLGGPVADRALTDEALARLQEALAEFTQDVA